MYVTLNYLYLILLVYDVHLITFNISNNIGSILRDKTEKYPELRKLFYSDVNNLKDFSLNEDTPLQNLKLRSDYQTIVFGLKHEEYYTIFDKYYNTPLPFSQVISSTQKLQNHLPGFGIAHLIFSIPPYCKWNGNYFGMKTMDEVFHLWDQFHHHRRYARFDFYSKLAITMFSLKEPTTGTSYKRKRENKGVRYLEFEDRE